MNTQPAYRRPPVLALALAAACSWADAAVVPIGVSAIATVNQNPVAIANAGDGSGRLFFVLQPGRILIWDGTQVLPTPFLDIQARVGDAGSEQGLLGLAFHPDYPANPRFYVDYTDNAGDTVISSFQVTADPNVADPGSEQLLLTIDQPFSNHNGGQVKFGPDGYLYIGMGDGGSGGDPGNRAQNLDVLLGKILRIDVNGDDFPGDPLRNYAIPPDNPFANQAGADEIWAYGVRNPWRFTFDRQTGDLFIADVGQNNVEEVDFQPAASPGGENYGWRLMEGTDCYNPPNNCNDGTLELPILEYRHFDPGFIGCAITGGYRYRGSLYPLLTGRYLYGDYCTGNIWGATEVGGNWNANDPLTTGLGVSTFGEDEGGELYLADINGRTIYRIFDTRPFCDVAVNQDSYVEGETVVASVLRLVNLGPVPANVRAQFGLLPPAGAPMPLLDKTLQLVSGFEKNVAPRSLMTVGPGTQRGGWQLVCRLIDTGSGQIIATDTSPFEVN